METSLIITTPSPTPTKVIFFSSEFTQPLVLFLQYFLHAPYFSYLCMSYPSYKIIVSLKTEITFIFIFPTCTAWCLVHGGCSVNIVELNN